MEIKQRKAIIEFIVTKKSFNIYTNIINTTYNNEKYIKILNDNIDINEIPDTNNTVFFILKYKNDIAAFINTIIGKYNKDLNLNICIEEGIENIYFINENTINDNRYLLKGCILVGYGITTYLYNISNIKLLQIIQDLKTNKIENIENEINTAIKNYEYQQKERCYKNVVSSKKLIIEISGFVAGFLFHEIIGHLLEEDFFKLPNIWIRYNYKETIPKWISITHNSGPYPELLGLGKYDDNGELFIDNILIENGKVKNSIGKGNYRRENFMLPSLPRMRTINVVCSKPCNKISLINNTSIFIHSIKAGMVNPYTGEFQLKGMQGYFHKNENFKTKNIDFSGNVNDLMRNIITTIGDNVFFTGICIKNNQKLNVGMNSPGIIFSCKNIKVVENE